jgi:hypothetical protein
MWSGKAILSSVLRSTTSPSLWNIDSVDSISKGLVMMMKKHCPDGAGIIAAVKLSAKRITV